MNFFSVFSLSFLFNVSQSLAQNPKLNALIPVGFSILDSKKCDINLDGIFDYIVILKSDKETVETEVRRPLLIVEGRKNGSLKLVQRNDKVVLCYDCGGVFGDPYEGIAVKKNYFSIEHYGGSNWRWTRIITFKYDFKLKKYMLHKDAGISYHTSEPDKTEQLAHHKKSWGKTEFKNYSSDF